MLMNLKNALATLQIRAAENLATDGNLAPVAMFCAGGRLEVVPLELQDKDAVESFIVGKIAAGAEEYSFIHEAWRRDADMKIIGESAVLVYANQDEQIMHTAPILREGRTPRLGKWRTEDLTGAEGRLPQLLD